MMRPGRSLCDLHRSPLREPGLTQRSCAKSASRCPTMRALLVIAVLAFAPAAAARDDGLVDPRDLPGERGPRVALVRVDRGALAPSPALLATVDGVHERGGER